MSNYYIGLATTPHDPAIAIINSKGEILFAEATERYLQNKRAWCNPPDDIAYVKNLIEKYCEKDANFVIATTWSKGYVKLFKLLGNNIFRKLIIKYLLPSSAEEQNFNYYFALVLSSSFNQRAGETIPFNTSRLNSSSNVIKKSYNHHYTHAAVACWSSPFEEGVCAIIDGMGEKTSISCYHYKQGKIILLKHLSKSRASLGQFYSYLCHLCGFSSVQGEEWKIMGLAAYGKFDASIYKSLALLLNVKDGKHAYEGYKQLEELRLNSNEDALSRADLAHTAQIFYCELVIKLLTTLYDCKLSDNLILGGGCALNSSCNGILLEKTPFKNLHVFSAPADDGNAVGAALLAYYEDNPPKKAPAKYQTPYLGAQMSPKVLANLKTYGCLYSLDMTSMNKTLTQQTAELLAQGKIIGWVQGRAEFGPRALGNRSILADPRYPDVKERLNAHVKFREQFRPFAPSILHEYGDEYFEDYQESPYMERTLRFKTDIINKGPGVVHVDDTGRLQTVKREMNEKYYDLILAFKNITGVPLILNTSFNVMGKPIIHSVEDAIAVFLTSGLDVLVIEDQIYLKDYVKSIKPKIPSHIGQQITSTI